MSLWCHQVTAVLPPRCSHWWHLKVQFGVTFDATGRLLWCQQDVTPSSLERGDVRCHCDATKLQFWHLRGFLVQLVPLWHHLNASQPKVELSSCCTWNSHNHSFWLTFGTIKPLLSFKSAEKIPWKLRSCWAWAFYNPRTILITCLGLCWFWCKILALKFLVECAAWIPSRVLNNITKRSTGPKNLTDLSFAINVCIALLLHCDAAILNCHEGESAMCNSTKCKVHCSTV